MYKYLAISLLMFSCKVQDKIEPIEIASQDLSHLYIVDQVDFMELDKFENLYWVNGKKLSLKDFQNDREYTYENDRLGNISSLDVSNPQKILVYYDDFDMVISLDNTLSERSRIDLKQYDYTDINAVGLSNDNNVWLYDPISFQLKKINERGQTLAESLNLNSLNLDLFDPTKIIEKNNIVYVNSPEDGIFVFDNLGQFIKIIPLTGIDDFQIIKDNIVYANQNGAFFYSTVHFDMFQIEAIDESRRETWKQFRLAKENYFLAFANGIQKGKR